MKFNRFFAELKRRGVTRLATIYAVVGLGFIEAFDIIGGRFLMPDWSFRFVIILALGGFPVAMILGWIFDITSKGIVKTEALDPTEQAALPSLSWKPNWFSIILFLILLLTTTAFFTVPRPNALNFKKQDWILIADLENNTGDEVFDKSLLHALTVTIDQSRYINIYPRNQVLEVLKRMKRESVTKIDVPLALEIAERENLKAVLVLTISELGGAYVLSTSLLNPYTGETVRSSQVNAPGKEEILDALNSLATDVRKDLGESLEKIHLRTVPLARATTHSLEALKYLTDAEYITNDPYNEKAKEMLKEAIKLDPDFALAHSNLAAYYYWINDRINGEKHIATALGLVDRLTEKERLWIQAAVEGYRGNREESVVKWGTYLSKYPDSYGGWFRLGYNYMMMNRNEESISAFTKSLEVYNDDDPAVLINIASCYSKLGDFQRSIKYYQEAFALNPEMLLQTSLNHEFGFTYVQMGAPEEARKIFEKLLNGNEEQRARGNRSMALLAMYQGKYSNAIELIHNSIVMQNSLGNGLSELRDRLFLACMFQRKGMMQDHLNELDHCSAIVGDVASEPWWYFVLGKMIVRNGDPDKASLMLEEISKRTNQGNKTDEAAYKLLKGEIVFSEGNLNGSLELLENATTLRHDAYTLESLSNCYFQTGEWDKAIEIYEEMVTLSGSVGWEAQDCYVHAFFNLAKAYEEAGDAIGAIKYYKRFLEIWSEADEDLPELSEAKVNLARLSEQAI